jgi:hypothetical protein
MAVETSITFDVYESISTTTNATGVSKGIVPRLS